MLEYWFNEKEQTFFERMARGKVRDQGSTDRRGNVFIWSIQPKSEYVVKSEWLQSLVCHHPCKPIDSVQLIKLAMLISAVVDECLSNESVLNFNKPSDLEVVDLKTLEPYTTYNQYGYQMTYVGNGKVIYKNLWNKTIHLFHKGQGFYHSEPLKNYLYKTLNPKPVPGQTDKHGWTILGVVDKEVDRPIGSMLDSISAVLELQPTLNQALFWFFKLQELIGQCYSTEIS